MNERLGWPGLRKDAFLFTLVEVVVGWSLDGGEELASYEILRLHSQMSAGGRTLHYPWIGDETCHAETT
jgi:hypothetical protein